MTDIKELNKWFTLAATVLLLHSCNGSGEEIPAGEPEADLTEMGNTNTVLPLDRFAAWVIDKENHLAKEKTISEINFQLSYAPKECLAYLELKDEEYTKEKFAETVQHYNGMTYFNLTIGLNEGEGELLKYKLRSPQQYNDRVNYLSFQMQKDIYLIQGKDTLYPGLYNFERIFSIAPHITVMLAFDNAKFRAGEEFTVVYNDKLFDKGFIKYNYASKQLIDLPNIAGV
jgi:hypothetical protein